MAEKYDVWNLLHDGEIADISGSMPEMRLRIAIPYLRDMFPCGGDSFFVSIHGCRIFRFVDWERGRLLPASKIVALETEILSVVLKGNYASVICSDGILALEYQQVSCQLDTGKSITVNELNHACNRYWNQWEKRAKDM